MTFKLPSKLVRLKTVVAYQRALQRLSEAKYTGLKCPVCRKDVAVIETATSPIILMFCPACGHRWTFKQPEPKAN
jgi:hypothetical protein